ncbi:MAG: C4-dicarboxylate ABC transporter permease, partial [Deltaproteobacteria bacterium]|nr:C4-dicarboxylate ABC transporter permease [Candidatus Tharpella sp.]
MNSEDKKMADKEIIIEDYSASGQRNLRGILALSVTVVAITLSLFQLYTAGIAPLAAIYQRSVHLVLILVLVFALYPPIKTAAKDKIDIYLIIDGILILLAITIGAYIWIEFNDIVERQGDWITTDVVMGTIAIFLVMEATRRVIGLFMSAIAIIFLLFTYFGPWMPDLLAHKGYSIERIVTTLY